MGFCDGWDGGGAGECLEACVRAPGVLYDDALWRFGRRGLVVQKRAVCIRFIWPSEAVCRPRFGQGLDQIGSRGSEFIVDAPVAGDFALAALGGGVEA